MGKVGYNSFKRHGRVLILYGSVIEIMDEDEDEDDDAPDASNPPGELPESAVPFTNRTPGDLPQTEPS